MDLRFLTHDMRGTFNPNDVALVEETAADGSVKLRKPTIDDFAFLATERQKMYLGNPAEALQYLAAERARRRGTA